MTSASHCRVLRNEGFGRNATLRGVGDEHDVTRVLRTVGITNGDHVANPDVGDVCDRREAVVGDDGVVVGDREGPGLAQPSPELVAVDAVRLVVKRIDESAAIGLALVLGRAVGPLPDHVSLFVLIAGVFRRKVGHKQLCPIQRCATGKLSCPQRRLQQQVIAVSATATHICFTAVPIMTIGLPSAPTGGAPRQRYGEWRPSPRRDGRAA